MARRKMRRKIYFYWHYNGSTMESDVKDTITAVVDDEENESNVKNRNGIPNLPHRNGSVVPKI